VDDQALLLLPQLLAESANPGEACGRAAAALAAIFGVPVAVLGRRDNRWEVLAAAPHEEPRTQPGRWASLARIVESSDPARFDPHASVAAAEWLIRPLDIHVPPKWAIAAGRGPDAALIEMSLDRIRGELGLAIDLCAAKAALKRSDLIVQRIAEMCEQLPPRDKADTLYRRILDAAASAGRATIAALALGGERDAALRIVATIGYPLALVEDLVIPTDAGILGFAYRSGEPILARSDEDFPALPRRRLRYRTPSFMAIPLEADERTLGVIALADRADTRPFDRTDFTMVRTTTAAGARMLRSLQLIEERQQLVDQTAQDPLTGLLNRRTLEKRLQEELERARRQHQSLAVLMIDVDYFKLINDSLGHLKGDETLRKVAEILRSSIRVFDVSARYGGDEFTILMPAISPSAVVQTAERIRRRIETIRLTGAAATPISVSIGGAILKADRSSDDLLERADRALYQAKAEGRNRISVADDPPP